MDGSSTLWILAFGVVVIQARHGNTNTNWNSNMFRRYLNTKTNGNSNMFRRNMNSNTNLNVNSMEPLVYRPSQRGLYDDENDYISYPGQSFPSGDSGREKVVEEVAAAAADAALSITKNYANDLSDSAAVAVADAVANIVTRRYRGSGLGRRNSNMNSNYNFNLLGPSGLTDHDYPQTSPENESPALSNYIQEGRYAPWSGPETLNREQHWGIKNDVDNSRLCGYRSSKCFGRRARPTGKIELNDDQASDLNEEKSTLNVGAEGDGADEDKEPLDDGNEPVDNELGPDFNATAAAEPTPARRSRKSNANLNDYRRYLTTIHGKLRSPIPYRSEYRRRY